jgi:hypothetical protein
MNIITVTYSFNNYHGSIKQLKTFFFPLFLAQKLACFIVSLNTQQGLLYYKEEKTHHMKNILIHLFILITNLRRFLYR